MKATKSILNIQSILKDFSGLAEARKSYTLRTRLVFIFCGVTIAMVLFFAHSVVNNAMNKILVVNEGGEFVHFKSMQQDLLYESLLKGHCRRTAYFLNSFDRLSLQENRARALFLVNKPDAIPYLPNTRRTVPMAMRWNSGLSTRRSLKRSSTYAPTVRSTMSGSPPS